MLLSLVNTITPLSLTKPLIFPHIQELRQKDEELRRLHKALAKRESDAKQRRDRLEEVEGDLRAALGGITGTKENLLEVSLSLPLECLVLTVRNVVNYEFAGPIGCCI